MPTILLVDDSRFSRKVLGKHVEALGHSILEAPDGETALEIYQNTKPDLVFLDLNMAGMYGLVVLKKIKEMDREAKVVIASADIQTGTKEEAFSLGAAGFMIKPFEQEEVVRVLDRVLKGDLHDTE